MRGIVALWIVIIHVAFHAEYGQPNWIKYLTLLIDVPAFFFISGMTRKIINKEMTSGALVKLALIFALLAAIFSGLQWNAILNALTFQGITVEHWDSFNWSYWFVPTYIIVLLFADTIIEKIDKYKYVIMVLLALVFPVLFLNPTLAANFHIFSVDSRHIAFYLALFLFGYFVREKIIGTENQKKFAIVLVGISAYLYLGCYLYAGESVFNLQANKFPAQLPYVLASMLSVGAIIAIYRRNIVASGHVVKFLSHCGRNALFYYTGQVVGTGIIIKLAPWFNERISLWSVKLVLFIPISIVLTIAAAELLRVIYNTTGRVLDKISTKLMEKKPAH